MPNETNAGRRFDRKHNVTTQAVLFLSDLDPEAVGDAGAHATHYQAVPVADFHALIRCVPHEAIVRSSFVDIGAGMGRAVLLASTYPFRSVRGIEISPGLCEVAGENVRDATELRRACSDVAVVHDDARLWNYPTGDVVAFMYNPFDGEGVAAALGALLHRRDAGETWLLYHTPVERILIEHDRRWNIVAETSSGVVYRYA